MKANKDQRQNKFKYMRLEDNLFLQAKMLPSFLFKDYAKLSTHLHITDTSTYPSTPKLHSRDKKSLPFPLKGSTW